MSASVSRRQLAKGAVWAAPAVLATTAVPAYAASDLCQASVLAEASSTLVQFDFGTPGYDRATGTYRSQTTEGKWTVDKANLTILDLGADEQVVSIRMVLAVDTRTNTTDTTSTSSYWDPTASKAQGAFIDQAEGWSFEGVTPAASRTITVDGITHTADMWTATFLSTGMGEYYESSVGDCREYASSDMVNETPGGFTFSYSGIKSLSIPTPAQGFYPNHSVNYTVTTSRGRTLSFNQLVLEGGAVVAQESILS